MGTFVMPSPAAVIADVLGKRPVIDGVDAIAGEVEVEATALAYRRAYDEGTYAGRIHQHPRDAATGAVKVVAEDPKSKWLEEGTGVYGPERRPITPKRGRYLVFRVKGGAPGAAMQGRQTRSGLIFARSVKGRPPSWVMRDASQTVADRHGLGWRNLRSFRG